MYLRLQKHRRVRLKSEVTKRRQGKKMERRRIAKKRVRNQWMRIWKNRSRL